MKIIITAIITVFLLGSCQMQPGDKTVAPNARAVSADDPTTGSSNANVADTKKSAEQTLCNNLYNPVGAAIERRHRVASNGLPASEMTETYTNLTADSFTVHSDFSASDAMNTDVNWTCTAEGITPDTFDGNRLQTGAVSGKFETIKVSGVSLPTEGKWKTGEKWNAKYDVKYTMNIGGSVRGEGVGDIIGAGEMLGEESVTVPAGTFQAMKVQTTFKMNITVKVGGATMPLPNQMPMKQISWYVKDIGQIKSVTTVGDTNTGTTELLSFIDLNKQNKM